MTRTHPRSRQIVATARKLGALTTAVVYPCSAGALAGALDAADVALIKPILIGPRDLLRALARTLQRPLGRVHNIDVAEPVAAARAAAALVCAGECNLLMKGSLHTDELMGVVVSRAAGLRTDRRVSHAFVMDVPTHNRLLLITDAAINIAPQLKTKRDIVQNAITLAQTLGIARPRVAILSAVETVNPHIPSTLDAAALTKMALDGEITGGIVEGPLAFDNAISAKAARVKGITSAVSGRVDILVVPGLEAGNMLYKQLVYLSNAIAAGVVLGARVPVILTSRADSAASRTVSAAVACIYAHARRNANP